MTPIQVLNRTMLRLEKEGKLSEEEYATYRLLLEAKDCLADSLKSATERGPRLWAENRLKSRHLSEKLK